MVISARSFPVPERKRLSHDPTRSPHVPARQQRSHRLGRHGLLRWLYRAVVRGAVQPCQRRRAADRGRAGGGRQRGGLHAGPARRRHRKLSHRILRRRPGLLRRRVLVSQGPARLGLLPARAARARSRAPGPLAARPRSAMGRPAGRGARRPGPAAGAASGRDRSAAPRPQGAAATSSSAASPAGSRRKVGTTGPDRAAASQSGAATASTEALAPDQARPRASAGAPARTSVIDRKRQVGQRASLRAPIVVL